MNFKQFVETRKELVQAYKDKLQGVPQDPVHHPEGDVFRHSQLVRKAIPKAVQELIVAQKNDLLLPLSLIDFNLSSQEKKILYLTAWLHDIGKATATTIDGQPWQQGG